MTACVSCDVKGWSVLKLLNYYSGLVAVLDSSSIVHANVHAFDMSSLSVFDGCAARICLRYALHDCVHGWNFNFNVFWKTDGFLLSLIWNFVESSWKIPSVCSLFLCRLMHKNWCAGFGCVSVLEQASQLTISTPPPIFCPQWKVKNKKGDFTVIVLL